ncbi:MAG: dehydrogenase, partial [Gammaproteobacteria bacterium HGW-Gammaproteobacteria-14]
SKGLTLAKVEAEPHGIDLGPLQSVFPQRLFTPDKRIRLTPPRYIHELLSLEVEAAPAPDEFRLIGRRHVRSNNSWMHNSYRLVKGKGRCTAMLHPADAARIGIVDGEEIEISSSVGSIRLPAEVTEDLMPGVISVPHGWGHARQGVQMGVATSHAGVSINDVISSDQVDRLTGTAILNGQSVTVRHCRAPIAEALVDEEA